MFMVILLIMLMVVFEMMLMVILAMMLMVVMMLLMVMLVMFMVRGDDVVDDVDVDVGHLGQGSSLVQ